MLLIRLGKGYFLLIRGTLASFVLQLPALDDAKEIVARGAENEVVGTNHLGETNREVNVILPADRLPFRRTYQPLQANHR